MWWDRQLVVGPRYEQSIQAELDAARCVVGAWSRSSVASSWCCDEAREGLDRQRLVPLLIEDVRPPLGCRSSHMASLLDRPVERGEFDQLVAGIRACLGASAAGDGQDEQADASIAVLPFSNLSSDPKQAFFCDGLPEDLIDLLVCSTDLRVIARTSSFQFRAEAVDVRDAGRGRPALRQGVVGAEPSLRAGRDGAEVAEYRTDADRARRAHGRCLHPVGGGSLTSRHRA